MKKIFYIAIIILLCGGCDKPEQLGPDVKGIYGDVIITQAFDKSNGNPNFAAGDKVYFTAKFQNDAMWKITIVGLTSGATKTISGVSKDIGSFNSMWDGSADGAPSFQVESVTATLTFPNNASLNFPLSLSIAGTKNHDVGGVLVSDFLVSKMYCYCGPSNPNGWPSDWPTTVNTDNAYVLPDGNSYMVMGGGINDKPWQGGGSPYVDILTIEAKNADVNYGTYFPLYADPTKVFFNMMVYGTGPNTWLKVTLFEDGVETRYVDIYPTWTGWKLVSINYSQLKSNVTTPAKSNKVTAVRFILLSASKTLPGPSVKAAFDHVIFTHNQPYQP